MKEKLEKLGIALPEGFSAGFCRKVVNPVEPIGLGGWGSEAKRTSNDIVDDICVSVTALSDGENVVIFISSDTLHTSYTVYERAAKALEEKFGIAKEYVVFNSTHAHSAPAVHRGAACPGLEEYNPIYYGGIMEAAEEALRDLTLAEAFIGSVDTEGLNYVRRYINREDGSYLGNWLRPSRSMEEARHETAADERLQTIRFVREGKKDIVMVNWQCHPCSAYITGEFATKVTPDWVAPMRQFAEEALPDTHVVYHQGACGNLVSNTGLLNEKSNTDYKRKGRELAYFVRQALKEKRPVETGKIRVIQEKVPCKLGKEWKEKSGEKAETYSLALTTLAIGDLAFATVPCEWHDTCGRSVREASPFKMTFIHGYTNGANRYIPAAFCWNNGGYEVKSCYFECGTGEKLARHHIDKLWELYNEASE